MSSQESDYNAMSKAINDLRAGRCHACGQPRIEIQRQESAGLGKGMRIVTTYACGTKGCSNEGKP